MRPFKTTLRHRSRVVESAIGAHLVNAAAFGNVKKLLVGGDGMEVEVFLSTPVEDLVGP